MEDGTRGVLERQIEAMKGQRRSYILTINRTCEEIDVLTKELEGLQTGLYDLTAAMKVIEDLLAEVSD